ncbi:MAG: phosphate acyltransferase PlsX [Trueperaceae bacterium]|nr:phosphate acyltransferase PlsX [Trueperaceae bacterium]
MGGDRMPDAAIDGALQAVAAGERVVLVGDEARLREALRARGAELPIVHAGDVIAMEDSASDVRRRKDASVVVAARLVKDGAAAAVVSMGHSGATLAAALLVLGRLPGVDRPAILANIPGKTGFTALIDAGANADCKPAYLQQFAVMGSVYARAFYGDPDPTVGLMSIGEEEGKGNELTLAAHALLKATPGIRFHGNVEGRDLLAGTTHVVVADGFTGNVMLKLAEGEAKVLFGMVRDALGSSLRAKIGGLLARPALRAIADRLDPATYGAQPLLGVDGYAFIGHGSADARAVRNALATARKMVDAGVRDRIADGLARLTPG